MDRLEYNTNRYYLGLAKLAIDGLRGSSREVRGTSKISLELSIALSTLEVSVDTETRESISYGALSLERFNAILLELGENFLDIVEDGELEDVKYWDTTIPKGRENIRGTLADLLTNEELTWD